VAPQPTPIRRADRARQVADVLRQQIHAGAFTARYLPSPRWPPSVAAQGSGEAGQTPYAPW
jgi:hypothetical protein